MPQVASSTTPIAAWQSVSAVDSTQDLSGACALLAVLIQSQSSTQSSAKTDIEISSQKLEELKKQLADAVEQAAQAAKHSGFLGFLGDVFGNDIAQIAGVVAAIAATVATGGAAATVLLMAASAALQVAAKVGPELGLDPKLCAALAIAAVAVGACSGVGAGTAASELATAAHGVETGAKVLQGGAVIAGGALHIASGEYHATELRYQADVVGYHAHETTTQLGMDDAIALLERSLRSEQHETSTVSELLQNDSETNTALCNRI